MTAEPIHLTNATPFDLIAEDAETWLEEARNWADGQPVENQKQADAVSMIIDALRKSADAAEKQRKVEVKPFDDAKAAVQERYAPLFAPATNKSPGKVHNAVAALKAVLAPYLRKLEEEKRAAEARAREEAERAAREAAEALRAANAADLAAREAAEEKVRQAEVADKAAKQAANDRAHANGGERAIGQRRQRLCRSRGSMTVFTYEERHVIAAAAKLRREARKAATKARAKSPKADRGRERDNGFLAYLRRQPCEARHIGGCAGPIQAAHIRYRVYGIANSAGLQVKNHDRHANPLCAEHHRIQGDIASERPFWAAAGKDAYETAAAHYAAYQKAHDHA